LGQCIVGHTGPVLILDFIEKPDNLGPEDCIDLAGTEPGIDQPL
jgi:hypothetical protein